MDDKDLASQLCDNEGCGQEGWPITERREPSVVLPKALAPC